MSVPFLDKPKSTLKKASENIPILAGKLVSEKARATLDVVSSDTLYNPLPIAPTDTSLGPEVRRGRLHSRGRPLYQPNRDYDQGAILQPSSHC
jgi:hypothetical protein